MSYVTAYYMQPGSGLNFQINDLTKEATWTAGFSRYYIGMLANGFDMATSNPADGVPKSGTATSPGAITLQDTQKPILPDGQTQDIRIVVGGDDRGWNTSWNTTGLPTKDAVNAFSRTSDQMTIDSMQKNIAKNGWTGVDFDDELNSVNHGFNVDNLKTLVNGLKVPSTYTFLGGYSFYNQENPYKQLKAAKDSGMNIDQYQLMAYGGEMWPTSDWVYVTRNLTQLKDLEIEMSDVILGATTLGLTSDILQTWLNTTTNTDPKPGDTQHQNLNPTGEKLGGLLLWSGSGASVDPGYMQQITGALGEHKVDTVTGTYPHSTISEQDNNNSNYVEGSNYSDVIVGQNMSVSQEAKGDDKVDHLTGNGSGDLFVLSTGGNHYKEGGTNDWAFVEDFKAEEGDRLQLSGDESEYTFSAHFGGMTIKEAGSSDVIAIVDGISPGSINAIVNSSIIYV